MLAVYSYKKIGDDSCKVVFRAPPININKDKFIEEATALFDNQVGFVRKSFKEVASSNTEKLYEVFAYKNVKSKPYGEETVKGMHVITANVFEDEEGMWAVKGDGKDRILVQTSGSDLDSLLEQKMSKRFSSLASSIETVKPRTGDFCTYYSVSNHDMRTGLVVASGDELAVIDRKTTMPEMVDEEQIQEVGDITDDVKDLDKLEATASADPKYAKEVLDILRDLLKDSPEYFKALEDSFLNN